MKRLIVGISGASGAVYGIRLLEVLQGVDGVETHLVLSPAGRRTIALETDYTVEQVEGLADRSYKSGDIAAAISSGSFRSAGMVVAPCSMKTVSGIATSYTDNLLLRAADVTLKDRRRLVLLVRETPLHLGHLRLLVQVAEVGAVVMPPMPAFYHRPGTLEAVIDQTVNRTLDLLDIELDRDLFTRWPGPARGGSPDLASRGRGRSPANQGTDAQVRLGRRPGPNSLRDDPAGRTPPDVPVLINQRRSSMAIESGFVRSIFASLAGDTPEDFLGHVADEVSWTVLGTHPLAGHYASKRAFGEALGRLSRLFDGGLKLSTRQVLVDGDWAAVELSARAVSRGGIPFNNDYCWMCRFRDETIVEVRAYLDSALVAEVMERGEGDGSSPSPT